MNNVIEFPRKRKTHAFTAHLAERDVSELHLYRCIHCRNEHRFAERQKFAVYCQYDGGEMRPVVEAEVR